MAISSLVLWALIALVGYGAYQQLNKKGQRNLPPGPKPLPILGNIKDFPSGGGPEYQHWLKFKDRYGGIVSLTSLGTTLVIIHDRQAAHELLDLTAGKTSGRASMVMASELCGWESMILCKGYNPAFRRHRKYLHRELGTKVSAAKFSNFQEIEVNRHLIRVLKDPENWLQHFRTNAAATVLKMSYGYTIEPHKPDPLVALAEQVMTEFPRAAAPMTWLVDVIPALKYLPEGFPGAEFKKTAREMGKTREAIAHIPYRFVQRRMASSNCPQSYVSRLVEQLKDEQNGELKNQDEEDIIWTAMSLYAAGADTSVITLTVLTMAMAKFEHVQRKAQEEIDRVTGGDRLPNFEDREKLPYINALIKEAMRWWPIAPLGFPHATTEDIEYRDFHIPKGSYLLPAVWWFTHDPEVYPEPEAFNPDRFLPPRNEPDPWSHVFGYGRRICPGRFFADASIYLNIAKSLAVFNISKAIGKDGKPIEVDPQQRPGILAFPTEFQVQITPRSEKHVQLVQQIERQNTWEEGDSEYLESIDGFELKYQ